MQNDIVGFHLWRLRQTNADPAMAFVASAEALRRYRVSEGEETRSFRAAALDTRDDQIVFLRKHAFAACSRNVATIIICAINCIAETHVVGRHGLCDGTSRRTRLKKPASDFLPSAYFSDGAVFQLI